MIRLFACLLVTLFFGRLLPYASHSQLLYWLVTLPGTTLHEGAHWIMAFILGGHPEMLSILPTFANGSMQTMGHVVFQPTALNSSAAGLAPYLLIFPSAWYVTKAATSSFSMGLLWCYVAACGFASLTPSSQDWAVAVSYPSSFLLTIPLFGCIAYVFWKIVQRRLRFL